MTTRLPLVRDFITGYPMELPAGDTTQPMADHLAAADPHPQYLLVSAAYIDGGTFVDTYVGSPFATDAGTFA